MDFSSIETLSFAGFAGFEPVAKLRENRCVNVPRLPGVYLITRPSSSSPRFRTVSSGGHFKGKDPSVPLSVLSACWIQGSPVLYIGKAGGAESNSTLRLRLSAYMRFGAGARVGHWGGRYIWQLEDCEDLVVCWRPCIEVDARQYEASLLEEFRLRYGHRPFANLSA